MYCQYTCQNAGLTIPQATRRVACSGDVHARLLLWYSNIILHAPVLKLRRKTLNPKL